MVAWGEFTEQPARVRAASAPVARAAVRRVRELRAVVTGIAYRPGRRTGRTSLVTCANALPDRSAGPAARLPRRPAEEGREGIPPGLSGGPAMHMDWCLSTL
ncbi:hypothetical protein GCM10025788_00370 [Serinicoccus chungangensis]